MGSVQQMWKALGCQTLFLVAEQRQVHLINLERKGKAALLDLPRKAQIENQLVLDDAPQPAPPESEQDRPITSERGNDKGQGYKSPERDQEPSPPSEHNERLRGARGLSHPPCYGSCRRKRAQTRGYGSNAKGCEQSEKQDSQHAE